MEPVARVDHNCIYKGSSPEVGDLSCFRSEPGEVWSHWQPTAEELDLLNAGGHVALGVYTEPIPPLSIGVVAAKPPPEDQDEKVVHLDDRR